MTEIPTRKLLALRLHAQRLSRRATSVVEACRGLFALQAQDFAQVQWALAVRTERPARDAIERAFSSRELVRAWSLRGTLHVVPAEDLGWLLQLLSRKNLARAAPRMRQCAISEEDVKVSRRIVERALRNGGLSREALLGCLERAGQAIASQRGISLLYALTQHGVLCQAGSDFVLAEGWIARPRALVGDEALATLARRYLDGHGPATTEDFAFWTGLGRREAKRAIQLAGAVEHADSDVPRALLLPGYDEYLLGYADRSGFLDAADFPRLVPGGNGVFVPMLVLDGRIRGTWRSRVEGDVVAISVTSFTKTNASQRAAIDEAAHTYGRFVGASARVEYLP